ncbi:hypothetical protein KKF84_19965 [Myxococcota bacterium]|nr:hypothetical protein [Myxococcota bacterium]MBU1537601.1 hypothetical protein [Myxococcota bacterium]
MTKRTTPTTTLLPLLLAMGLLASACGGEEDVLSDNNTTNNTNNTNNTNTPEPTSKVDLLFVVDNSLSMAAEQALLVSQFGEFTRVLREAPGGMPDLHVGVISTDLGTLPYNIPSCTTQGGDGGRLLAGPNSSCSNPVGQRYIVDIAPKGCTVERDPGDDSVCTASDCSVANCTQDNFVSGEGYSEPDGLQFVEDENGCPRCRNYSGEDLETVFSCNASLGTAGCGFEQPLESMRLALSTGNTANARFVRSEAMLAVLFLTDKDDCSADNVEIFNPEGGISDTLGPLTSFRCTEFGIRCDEDWQRIMPEGSMSYNNCVARTQGDAMRMLYPVSRYTDFLRDLKGNYPILMTTLSGPYVSTLNVGVDENQHPRLGFSCGEAVPAVRLREFVSAFQGAPEGNSGSICDSNYAPTLISLGEAIRANLPTAGE